MTDLKEKVNAGIDILKEGVSDTAKQIDAVLGESRRVIADAGNDAKDAAVIVRAKVRMRTRSVLGELRRPSKGKKPRSPKDAD
jgi:hypothetical protein